jgi:transposase
MGPALVVEGGADHAACAAYVETLLVPSLRRGQVVVMDRLNVHRGVAIRQAIEAAGCEMRLLPAYSPDFNPIEPVFAKLKTHVRAAEARTIPAVIRTIGTALDRITPADACHCYTHCGYPLSAQLL